MDTQRIKNTQQTIVNKNLQQLVINKVNEYTQGLEVVDSIHYHHIGHTLKNASVYKSVKIPKTLKGVTICVVRTDKNMYCSLTICSSTEKNFDRRMGVYYALRSFLNSNLKECSSSYLFPNDNFEMIADKYKQIDPTTKLNAENLFVKALISSVFYHKNIFENKSKIEMMYTAHLEKQILDDLKKQKDVVVEQVAHFRPIVKKQSAVVKYITNSAWKTFSEKADYILSSHGGITVTFMKKATEPSKYIISMTTCSPQDNFSRTEGRFQSLYNFLQNKKNCIYQMTINEGEDVFQKFVTTFENNLKASNLTLIKN